MKNGVAGLTLIELMVVVVIVAILASIAVPSYRQHVLRTHRTEAKRSLLNVSAAQERFYLQNNTYASSSELTIAPPAGLGIPATTENGHYEVAITTGNVTGFWRPRRRRAVGRMTTLRHVSSATQGYGPDERGLLGLGKYTPRRRSAACSSPPLGPGGISRFVTID